MTIAEPGSKLNFWEELNRRVCAQIFSEMQELTLTLQEELMKISIDVLIL